MVKVSSDSESILMKTMNDLTGLVGDFIKDNELSKPTVAAKRARNPNDSLSPSSINQHKSKARNTSSGNRVIGPKSYKEKALKPAQK